MFTSQLEKDNNVSSNVTDPEIEDTKSTLVISVVGHEFCIIQDKEFVCILVSYISYDGSEEEFLRLSHLRPGREVNISVAVLSVHKRFKKK